MFLILNTIKSSVFLLSLRLIYKFGSSKKLNYVYYSLKRKAAEIDSFIFQFIQKDLVEDFILHVNKKSISLKSTINLSDYETNAFLFKEKVRLNEDVSLIEYATFCGSIQIIRYLLYNDVDEKPSLWHYAIHSNNPEVIYLLEEKGIQLTRKMFQ